MAFLNIFTENEAGRDLHFHLSTDPSSAVTCAITARSLSRGKFAIFSVMIWKMEVCL